jgi:hypothetical protein
MLKSMKKLGGGKRKPAETVVAYEKKTITPSSKSSISKADAEAHMGRMENMFEEQRGIEEGERQFGSGYKGLDLKATRQKVKNLKEGTESVRTSFRSKDGNEEVTKLPDSDLVEVKRVGDWEKAGMGGTDKMSVKDFAEAVKAKKRAHIEAIMKQEQPKIDKYKAEMAAAKSKAGGK